KPVNGANAPARSSSRSESSDGVGVQVGAPRNDSSLITRSLRSVMLWPPSSAMLRRRMNESQSHGSLRQAVGHVKSLLSPDDTSRIESSRTVASVTRLGYVREDPQ